MPPRQNNGACTLTGSPLPRSHPAPSPQRSPSARGAGPHRSGHGRSQRGSGARGTGQRWAALPRTKLGLREGGGGRWSSRHSSSLLPGCSQSQARGETRRLYYCNIIINNKVCVGSSTRSLSTWSKTESAALPHRPTSPQGFFSLPKPRGV